MNRWGGNILAACLFLTLSATAAPVINTGPTSITQPGGIGSASTDPVPYIISIEGIYNGSTVQLAVKSVKDCSYVRSDFLRVIYTLSNSSELTLSSFDEVVPTGSSVGGSGQTIFHCAINQSTESFPQGTEPTSANLYYSNEFSISGQVIHGVVITGNAVENGSGACGAIRTRAPTMASIAFVLLLTSFLILALRSRWGRPWI